MIERPRISRWVWQPCYAKLWWVLIATYWTIGAGALWIRPLAEFYTSNLGSWLRIVLFPVFAFCILSIGWIKAWVEALDYAAAHPEAESKLGWMWSTPDYEVHQRAWSDFDDPANIHSPQSGFMYVGNSHNPSRHLFDRKP